MSRLSDFHRMGQTTFVVSSLSKPVVTSDHDWSFYGVITVSTCLLCLSATGPGCSHLDDLHLASAVYFMEAGELYANVTCDYGYVIPGTDVDFVRIRCKGQTWSKAITECTGTKKV